MKAIYGPVVEIKALASRGVTRISIEIPEEYHKEVTGLFYSEHVLITHAPKEMRATNPFGVVGGWPETPEPESQPPAPENPAIDGDVAYTENEEIYGDLARELKLSGFFRAPKVYEAIGSDEEYQAWCRTKRCAITRKIDTSDPIVFAHVRRARNSGTSFKPKYHGLPLCDSLHRIQHEKGEAAALMAGAGMSVGPDAAKEWFDVRVLDHLEQWGWETLKAELGYESWKQVPPIALRDWAQENGVTHILPRGYRDE